MNEDPQHAVEARRPGIDPLVDIVTFGHSVFSSSADSLVREILALGGRASLPDLRRYVTWGASDDFYSLDDEHLDEAVLEGELTEVRDRLEAEGRANGWEVDRLLEHARRGPSGT